MPKSVAPSRFPGNSLGGADAPAQSGSPHTDRQLIDAALGGDTHAWELLYHQCHGPLLASARATLGVRHADADQIDELAARVWYSLVQNRGELLNRFDPTQGCRLTTFLSQLARDHGSRMFRSERRRKIRETISCEVVVRNGQSPTQPDDTASVQLAEFEATLSPKEREFYREIVAASDPASEKAVLTGETRSDANRWQLQSRVRQKLKKFLDS